MLINEGKGTLVSVEGSLRFEKHAAKEFLTPNKKIVLVVMQIMEDKNFLTMTNYTFKIVC